MINKAIMTILSVLLLLSSEAFSKEQQIRLGQKVSFLSNNEVVINGLYKAPAGKMKTFIFLHGLGSNQEEWQTFIGKLIRQGYGFLSYDARGHGSSTHAKNGKKINYESFKAPGLGSNWEKMLLDLDNAVKFLNSKGIAKNRIGLCGASLGANVCLIYSAVNPEISPVVLLSPGMNYAGLDVSKAILEFKKTRPVLFVAAPQDSYSYQSSFLLLKQIEENKKAEIFQGVNSSHGVQMFDDKMTKQVLRWISKY